MNSSEPTTPAPFAPRLSIQTVLAPTDFSPQAGQALEQALYVARRHGASLQVLHVVETPPSLLAVLTSDRGGTLERMVGKAEGELELLLSEHDLEDVAVSSEVIQAKRAAPAVLDYATEHDADLIVMPTHGQGNFKRLFLGSTTETIIREAPCPVFIARERRPEAPPHALHHILKPVDFSDDCCDAIPLAKELAQTCEADLQVLHVVEDDPPPVAYELDTKPVRIKAKDVEEQVRRHMQQIVDEAEGPPVAASYHVTTGQPAAAIVDFAEEHATDLIVLSAHGHSGLHQFVLGSTAERVARSAGCPVLVVHAKRQDAPPSVD